VRLVEICYQQFQGSVCLVARRIEPEKTLWNLKDLRPDASYHSTCSEGRCFMRQVRVLYFYVNVQQVRRPKRLLQVCCAQSDHLPYQARVPNGLRHSGSDRMPIDILVSANLVVPCRPVLEDNRRRAEHGESTSCLVMLVSGNALELGITCLHISRRHAVVYDPNLQYQYRLKFLKRKKKQGWCPSLWPVKDKQIHGGLDTVKKMWYFNVTDQCFSAECETQSPSMCDPLGKCTPGLKFPISVA